MYLSCCVRRADHSFRGVLPIVCVSNVEWYGNLTSESWYLVNDQRDAQFFIMYVVLYLTLYIFRAHRAHHQERQIVSIQLLVTVGGRVVCRSAVNFRPAHDPATDRRQIGSYQRVY
jgi:hypothetical protein